MSHAQTYTQEGAKQVGKGNVFTRMRDRAKDGMSAARCNLYLMRSSDSTTIAVFEMAEKIKREYQEKKLPLREASKVELACLAVKFGLDEQEMLKITLLKNSLNSKNIFTKFSERRVLNTLASYPEKVLMDTDALDGLELHVKSAIAAPVSPPIDSLDTAYMNFGIAEFNADMAIIRAFAALGEKEIARKIFERSPAAKIRA